MSDEKQTCPRRAEGYGYGKTNEDTWQKRDGKHRQCSFCGCLHPDEFMQYIRDGAQLDCTDKNYKVYIRIPDPRVGKLRVLSSSNGPSAGLTPYKDLSRDEKAAVREKGNRGFPENYKEGYYKLIPTEAWNEAKFYYMHLSEEQMDEVLALFNAGKINFHTATYGDRPITFSWGVQGPLPYFMRRPVIQ